MKTYLILAGVVLVLALVLAFSEAAPAGCATATYTPYVAPYTPSYVNKVVTEIVPVAVYQAFPVFVPTFTVGYNPPPAFPGFPTAPVAPPHGTVAAPPAASVPPPPVASTTGGLAEVLVALQRIDSRLTALEKGQPLVAPSSPGALVPPRTTGALALFTAKCAACHKAGNEAKGKGFVLLDAQGQLVKLQQQQSEKLIGKLYYRRMPPKDNAEKITPLTEEETATLLAEIDTQTGATK